MTSQIKCTACAQGFNLTIDGACTPICLDSQYATTISGRMSCLSCHYSCKRCYGGDYTQCKECQVGYVLTEYNTCDQEQIQEEPTCSELEYYDSMVEDCLCIDGYMWDPVQNQCASINLLVQDCGVG